VTEVGAWVVRAGVMGQRDAWALTNGLAGGGFIEFTDLSNATSREAVRQIAERVMAGAPAGRIANFVGQMWALRSVIKQGDLVILPLKTTKRLAFGVCREGYRYLADQPEDRRHAIGVDWKRTDVPRSALNDDLLNIVNGAMTVFRATRNNAAARLLAVLEGGTDPGAGGIPIATIAVNDAQEGYVDPAPAVTLEVIRDRVRTHIVEHFSGHALTGLVADILRAHGYTCDVSPPGGDFGIDILARSGPLGLDSPTLVVEVKSGASAQGVPVINQLQGAVHHNHADQALLVAWGGLTPQAEQLRKANPSSLRVWTDDDVLDQLFETYETLPDETRAAIPLKRALVLVEETG